VETFRSGDFGFLSTIDQDRVVFARSPLRRQHIALKNARLPRVDIVPMYAGADGTLIRAAATAGARGIVMEAAGSGNVNLEMYGAVCRSVSGVV